ncbi:MAG: hypothetical protein LBC27_10345 [Spirochaetaceae bacterium]|jgi:hypothetical protein|nr:hypothetical protein [Spirochaetaceae bacterium]
MNNYARPIVVFTLFFIMFTTCSVPYSVFEPPEYFTMEGRIFIDPNLPPRWMVRKVVAITENGNILGEAVPTSDGTNMIWYIPVVAEENSIGTFWVELRDGISSTIYYNGGSDERFISGGHYDLVVNQDSINIPIGSYNQLKLIGKDASFPADANYVLLRDIAVSGDWEPLCKTGSEPFSGVFDGHNHTISGLKLVDNGSFQYIGLFGYMRGSAVKLAGLENLNLKIANTELRLSEVNEQCFGVAAGFAENAFFDKVTVYGPSQGLRIEKNSGGNFYIGGIAGKIAGSFSVISRSSTLFSVEVDSESAGLGHIGGIAGYAQSYYGSISISKCYSTGLVAISNMGQGAYAGGILGYYGLLPDAAPKILDNSTISESYARGEVSSFGSGKGVIIAAGGIVGGSDTAGDEYLGYVGLAGTRSCALMSSVTAAGQDAAIDVYAGGFSGYQLADSEDCFQLNSMELIPAPLIPPLPYPPPPPVDVTPIDKSVLTEKWFSGAPLAWDFSLTWQWDARTGYPKFLWQ